MANNDSIYDVNENEEASLRVTENGTGDASSIYCVNDEGKACMRVSENVTSDDPTSIYGINEEGKACVRVVGAGGGTVINNEDINVTSNGEYTAGEGYTGLGRVNVNVPNPSTGTKNITENGVYDVTDFASADVQVPTTTPAHYVEKSVDANGKLVNSGTMINLTGVTDIGNRGLYSEYYQGTFPADTTIDMSGLTQITGEFACYSMFSYASGIKVVNLNNLTTVQGRYACGQMFNYASGITNVDLSSLTTISGQYGCSEMFSNAVVTSVDMSSLTTVGTYACYNMFNVATISNIDLSSLTTVDVSGCSAMFRYARNIESVIFSSLTTVADQGLREGFESCASIKTVEFNKVNSIAGVNAFYHTFSGCTKLESVKFGGFKASTIIYPNIISSIFNSKTGRDAPNGCTVHFPSNFDPSDPNHTFDASTLTGYPTFGGNANYIHVAFDLPATE